MGIAPTPLPVDPRLLTGTAAVVIAALLLLLYFYRRRHYVFYWTAGWLLIALSMFVAVPGYGSAKARWMAYGVSQFLGIMAALVFVVSAHAYRTRQHLRRVHGMTVLPVLLWFALAPLALGPGAVFAPGHVLIGGGLAAAGLAHFALLRQTRLLGAVIIGISMLGLAAMNAWLALGVPDAGAPAGRLPSFVALGLYLVTILGMQLMTFEDMTYELRQTNRRLESAQEELRRLVTTDALTGCRNRRFFDEIIGREMERHRRYRIPLSLMFVDVDRFKSINDTLGHEAGDRVLQHVAAFLIKSVREADYVFRWGGDEFLIVISCTEAEARRKSLTLRNTFAASRRAASLPSGVGLSVGAAEIPPTTRDPLDVVKIADERMYAEKKRDIPH